MKAILLSTLFALISQFAITQSSSLNLSTGQTVTPASSNWMGSNPTGVTFTQSTFYGHTNWLSINNPKVTTYTFKRDFWVCKSGDFTLNIPKALGDNHIKVYLDGTGSAIIDKNVTVSSQFNTPAKYTGNHKLKCGKHNLTVTITNHGSEAGLILDCLISSTNGGLVSNGECCCCDKEVDARANVTISCGPASSSITASGMVPVNGLGQGWVLKKINCPIPNNCSWVAGPIAAQGTGPIFNFNGLQVGSCYILTHYVNKCSSIWKPGDCRVARTICFTVSCPQSLTTSAKMSSQSQTIPLDNIKFQELTSDMEKEILEIKNN